MKESIIIIGANGNIGKYLVDYMVNHLDLSKYELIATGTSDEYKYSFYSGKYVKLDILKKDDFKRLPNKNVKAVIDLAGAVPAYLEKEDYQVYVDINVTGTLNVLEYCRSVGAERIVYTQTWADLHGYLEGNEPLKPYSARKPITKGDHAIYCATKSCAVDMINCFNQMYGIKGFIFRLPNIYMYSPEMYYYKNGEELLISYRYMIERAIKGLDIEVWGNPTLGKDIIYVKDLCQMIFKAVFAPDIDYGVYNAGTGIKTTMEEQVRGIIQVFSDKSDPSKIVFCPEKPDCDNFVMDISNIKEDLGYIPQYDYISYLEDYKKEMKENRFVKRNKEQKK